MHKYSINSYLGILKKIDPLEEFLLYYSSKNSSLFQKVVTMLLFVR